MDLKGYFKKIRDVEATIPAPYVLIASLETPEGGKEGTFTEVSRRLAARIIAESRGRLATEAESELFREKQAEALRAAQALAAAQRMQFTLVKPIDSRPKPARGPKD